MSPRILVVEDGEMDRLMSTGILLWKGFMVDAATDVAGATALLGEGSYDLVLMKATMPGFRELVTTVRAAGDGCVRTAIAATAKASSRSEVGAVADVFIERPLPAAVFLSRIEAALDSRSEGAWNGVWDASEYRALERRLGRDRTLRQLERVADRLVGFAALVADASASDEQVARFGHDILAVGGMLGFGELVAACRRSQAAFHGTTGPARCEGLAEAIARAVAAASEAIASIRPDPVVVPPPGDATSRPPPSPAMIKGDADRAAGVGPARLSSAA